MPDSNSNHPDKLKVLIATALPPPDHGGIASWARNLRGQLSKDPDIELTFVDTTVHYRSPVNSFLGLRLVGGLIQGLRDTCRIYKKIKANRPNLLHLTTSGGLATVKDLIILTIARRLGVPSVIHYHMGRFPGIIERAGIEWKLTRRTMRMADVVIPLDKTSESDIKAALPGLKVVKLPNMVEIDVIDQIRRQGPPSPPCPEGCARLVYAGHVIPKKGLRELVSACVQISSYPIVLDIVGPFAAGFKKQLMEIASRAGRGKWLNFLGWMERSEAIRHIAHADIFVLPSYTEGMPNVVLEAMACERAILSTTVGAMPEMLDIGGPGECGVCVPPRNADALADAIRDLLQNPQLRGQLGRKARQRALQLYSVPVGCEQLLNLWRSLGK
ncbi:MAG: glycosyltransferase [Thermoguttaceae bacterium]